MRIFPNSWIFRIPEIYGFYGNSLKLGQIHRYLAKYDRFQRNADLLRKVEYRADLLRKVENQRNAEISGEIFLLIQVRGNFSRGALQVRGRF